MNIFELVATLRLDSSDYEKGIDDARGKAKGLGDGLKKGFGIAAGAAAAAVSAAAAGIAAISKQAVSAYGNYEQLVGGVETLFGARGAASVQEYASMVGKAVDEVGDEFSSLMEAQNLAMENASRAYQTAGLSANDYMQTMTSFAASLKQSTSSNVEAAQVADMAMQDMSDNANKMGTSMESIQNAYQGFAKQNYMMLDNLKLGYGGTKTEMERLLADAEKIHEETTGEVTHYDINNLADVYNAIHDVQENLGITGTTAKEAMTTIQGAANMTKAAWENVLTAMAGGGDLEQAMDGLITALFGDEEGTGLLNQIIPRLQQTFKGIGQFISKAAPYIAQNLPQLIQSTLPALLNAAIQLVVALIQNLPQIISMIAQALIDNFPLILEALLTLGEALLNWLVELVMSIQDKINSWFSELQGKIDAWFQGVGDKISEFIARVREKASEFIQAGVEMITGFIQSLYQGFLSLLTSVGEWVQANIIQPIKDKVGGMLEAGQDLVARVKEGLQDGFSGLLSAVGGWVNDYIIQPIKNKATEMYNVGKSIIDNMWNGLKDAWASVKAWWDGLTFSIKKATVIVDKPAGASEHAGGLEYVPYNDYPALLHVGEMVLTKNQADNYRAGNREGGNGITIVQNISATPQTPVDFAAATAAYFEQARWALI